MLGQLGELAHGVYAYDALQSQVRLERQPAREIISRDCVEVLAVRPCKERKRTVEPTLIRRL